MDEIKQPPTISIDIQRDSGESFYVQMLVTGLANIDQAEAAANHMQKLFCGSEIQPTPQQLVTCKTCESLARSVMMDQTGNA
jgi:hypothetical protein